MPYPPDTAMASPEKVLHGPPQVLSHLRICFVSFSSAPTGFFAMNPAPDDELNLEARETFSE